MGKRKRTGLQRKKEIDQDYGHQVEIVVALCLGENRGPMRDFCQDRDVASRRYYARRKGIDFLTWCFAKKADAKAFEETFGGKYITPKQHCGQRLSLHYDRKTLELLGF